MIGGIMNALSAAIAGAKMELARSNVDPNRIGITIDLEPDQWRDFMRDPDFFLLASIGPENTPGEVTLAGATIRCKA